MASVVLSGDTSGSVTIAAPAVAGSTTQTLVNVTGTLAPVVSGTVNAGGTNPFPSSSGPATVDFTSIPSWVKRITVMFSGVSTNGSSNVQVQLGSGSFTTSGYVSLSANVQGGGTGTVSSTTGFIIYAATSSDSRNGQIVFTNISSNIWAASHAMANGTTAIITGAGNVTLSGTLDRVRVTTVNGTDLFDAGSINILYE
jgi:hypothetical protein